MQKPGYLSTKITDGFCSFNQYLFPKTADMVCLQDYDLSLEGISQKLHVFQLWWTIGLFGPMKPSSHQQ